MVVRKPLSSNRMERYGPATKCGASVMAAAIASGRMYAATHFWAFPSLNYRRV